MKKILNYKAVLAVLGGLFVAASLGTANVSAENTSLRVNVGDVISISAPDKASMTAPTGGGFVNKSIAVIVNTNNANGYTLKISGSNSGGTTMTSATTSGTITSTFSGTKTSSTMADNTWGYSTAGTNYSKIPAYSSPATIKTTSAASVDSTSSTTVYFGIKTAKLLPSGKYTGTIVFTATTN